MFARLGRTNLTIWGGKPKLTKGRLTPAYFCDLMTKVPEMRAPGFRLRLPLQQPVHLTIKAAGAFQIAPRQSYHGATATNSDCESRHWYYAHTTDWQAIRAALPTIVDQIAAFERATNGQNP